MCPRGAKIRFCDFGVRLVPARRKFCGIQKVPQGMILRPLLGVRYRNSQSPIVLSKNAQKPIKFALGANMVSTELSPLQPPPPFSPLPGGPRGPPKGAPGAPREGGRAGRGLSCTQCKCSSPEGPVGPAAGGRKFFFWSIHGGG
jgi:hypothetical protein